MNKKFWNKKTKNLSPYIPGEQPKDKFIKLNTNENPYPPSPEVSKKLKTFDYELLRKYPDPSCKNLKLELCEFYGVEEECVFVGNGSDEVLSFAFRAFFDEEMQVAFPEITYSFYPVYANFYDIPFTKIPLKENYSIDVKDYFNIDAGVVIANPNAPTGTCLELNEIKQLLDSNTDRLVIVDEAYIDFGGDSSISLIDEYDNLLVVQTFSKSRSLAGIRVGFAIGNKSLIKALESIRDCVNSYTLDSIAQEIARVSLADGEWFETSRINIIETREWFTQELIKLRFNVLPSKANFVFASHPDINAFELFNELRKKGILVRYFDNELTNKFLRITIGTNDEMKEVVAAFINILEEK